MPIGKVVTSRQSFYNRRVILGVVLILLSVAAVILAVKLASQMERYYVAKHPIVIGQKLDDTDFTAIEANPGTSASKYLLASHPLPSQLVARQNIGKGELIPKSALSEVASQMKTLVIALSRPLPQDTQPGTYLELWQLPEQETWEGARDSGTKNATKIASKVVLVGVNEPNNALTNTAENAIEIMIPAAELPALLVALGTETPLVAIPVIS